MSLLPGLKTKIQLKIPQNHFFQSRHSHTGPLFKDPKTLQSFDKTAFENWVYINKYLKGLLPSAFSNWFKF